jgi:L-rhamnose mutarotase
MRNLASSNDGNFYILTCIDVFSRYAFAVPVKDKRGSTVTVTCEKIFAERVPNMMQTDRGTEFYNVQVQELFEKNGVRHYSSLNDDTKAALVETFNRTLKSRLFRYMTRSHTKRWIDVIDDVVNSYTRSHRRPIGATPIDVATENEDDIARRQYSPKLPFKYRYDVGDRVCIAKYKHVFQKVDLGVSRFKSTEVDSRPSSRVESISFTSTTVFIDLSRFDVKSTRNRLGEFLNYSTILITWISYIYPESSRLQNEQIKPLKPVNAYWIN